MIGDITGQRVRWADLRPDEFAARLADCPLVYLPVGLCEPHGHVAAFGLDTHKADWLCDTGAQRFGGIVAPTQGYHIHESGYHAPWLEEVIGEENCRIAALPPHVFCYQFLYQLRAFANAGFATALVLTGHLGGNERDLAVWGNAFTERFGMTVVVTSDMALAPSFPGDHAGKYEISLLMHLRPDLVDLSLLRRGDEPGSGGRLALGDNAGEATPEYGAQIASAAITNLGKLVEKLYAERLTTVAQPIAYEPIEALYAQLYAQRSQWVTMNPWSGQRRVTEGSRWQPYENPG